MTYPSASSKSFTPRAKPASGKFSPLEIFSSTFFASLIDSSGFIEQKAFISLSTSSIFFSEAVTSSSALISLEFTFFASSTNEWSL